MAQRKSSAPSRAGASKSVPKSAAKSVPKSAPKSVPKSAPKSARPASGKPAAKPLAGPRTPGKKPGKSIVNQRQTPWGMIIAAVVVVVFAAGVITYAVTRSSGSSNSAGGGSVKPATASVAEIEKIPGIVHKNITSRSHVTGVVNYGSDSPPFGGNHNQYWAQCTGVVYDHQLANENAVHTLEHGAIWITYRPGLDEASITKLSNKVLGQNYMLMTPYAGLKTPISLQAWGFQLFVNSADDPRIDQFIADLRLNPNTIPEYGASCNDPQFVASKSTPGHPFNG